jgi:hypothetical protein
LAPTVLVLPTEVVTPKGTTDGMIVGTLGCPSTVIAISDSSTAATADEFVHVNDFLVRPVVARVAAVVRGVVGATHSQYRYSNLCVPGLHNLPVDPDRVIWLPVFTVDAVRNLFVGPVKGALVWGERTGAGCVALR